MNYIVQLSLCESWIVHANVIIYFRCSTLLPPIGWHSQGNCTGLLTCTLIPSSASRQQQQQLLFYLCEDEFEPSLTWHRKEPKKELVPLPNSTPNPVISGQWRNIAGYQDIRHSFWKVNCEFRYGIKWSTIEYGKKIVIHLIEGEKCTDCISLLDRFQNLIFY